MRRHRHRGECFARDDLPAMVRPEMLEQIAGTSAGHRWCWCRPRSTCTCAVVRAAGPATDLQPAGCSDGRLTGRPRRRLGTTRSSHPPHCDLSRRTRIHAYGDSSEDKPMLALAHERWFRGRIA
jgi:hypothetical protein